MIASELVKLRGPGLAPTYCTQDLGTTYRPGIFTLILLVYEV